MGGTTPRKGTQTTVSDFDRARRRAAFLATIRSASQTSIVPARASTARAATARAVTRPPQPEARRPPATVERRAPTSTPAVSAAPPPQQPRGGLFREEALKHRLAFEEGRGLVHVSPPWTWAVVALVVAALGSALALSFTGQVDVTSRGRGIVRPASGVRALTSQLTGTVARVEARSGDRVKAGSALLRIESPNVDAQILEADRQLDALRTQYASVAVQQDHHYAEQVEQLKARERRVAEQIDSLRSTEAYYQRRLEADQQLLKKGLVSEMAVGEFRESLAQAQRQLSGAKQTLDQTRQELASLEGRRQDELWQRQQLLSSAKNKRDSLALVLRQSVIVAPVDGAVEGLLVKVGETVQAGQVVGKVIPESSPLRVVSFLAERDRAFAKQGDEVRLELDQLPHAQYGTLRGRMVRISDDLASASEIQEALGDQKLEIPPSYRVEIEITDAGPADAAHVKLRTGALMNVRYTLRRQKLITLVFNPLRRWFR